MNYEVFDKLINFMPGLGQTKNIPNREELLK